MAITSYPDFSRLSDQEIARQFKVVWDALIGISKDLAAAQATIPNVSGLESRIAFLEQQRTSLQQQLDALREDRYEDLRFPAAGINPAGAANPPDIDGDTGCLLFSTVADEIIGLQAQMPHEWHEGTTIYPHIHWEPTSAAAGNVYWRMQYKHAPINAVHDAAWTTLDAIAAAHGLADYHQITPFGGINMNGRKISHMLLIRVMRKGDAEPLDTYGADARLLEFDIHFLIDSQGSRQLFIK